MKIKSATVLLACLLLLSSFPTAVIACVCDPPCTGCQTCEDGVCVDDDSKCDYICCNGSCCSEGQNCCDDSCCSNECCNNVCCDAGEECCGGECCDPDDCCNGTCCDPDDCYQCVGGECIPCKCWDTGTAISGSITVKNANLCTQVTHTSSISDTDHWVLGGGGEDTPSDTVTYSWSKTAGTNPQTGTFIGDTNDPSVTWQAPPCTGTVIIKLTANDKPDSMDNPCPDSTRNDDPNDFQGTSMVFLPYPCVNAGAHDSSIHWIKPNDDFNSTTCTVFGDFYRPYGTCDVDFKYDSCKWVCEITNLEAETRIRVRDPNSLLPGKVSVSQASDVPCADANLAKYDLNDANTADDKGAPRTKYWCYNGTVAHEQKHRTDWQTFYGNELANAVSYCESLDVSIDCDDPNTITCGSAKSLKMADINARFSQAYSDAYDQYNLPGTPLKEHEQRAYLENYSYEQPISAALPGGCTP